MEFWRHPNKYGELLNTKKYNGIEHTLYYQKETRKYGEILSFVSTLEIEGNIYTYGLNYVYKNVNLNSKAINIVNKNSDFSIKLGTKEENIANINDYKKHTLFGAGDFIYGLSNETEEEYYGVSSFYFANGTKYVTLFSTTSEEITVCGIKLEMSNEKAKTTLFKLSFKRVKKANYYDYYVNGNVIIRVSKTGNDDSDEKK